MRLVIVTVTFLSVAISLQTDIATYMMSPQRHSNTLVEGEVTVPKDLVNFTFCLRVKPRLNRGETTCEPIAVSYKDRKTDEELLTIRTAKNRFSHTPSELVLHVWTRDCPEVYQYQEELRCDGIWRTVCVTVIKDTEIALTVQRVDEGEVGQEIKRPCNEQRPGRNYRFETPVIKTGGKFAFNTVQIRGGDKTIKSDSKIKDVMLWGSPFNDTSSVKLVASGDAASIPNKDDIVWIFNSKASLMQSGAIVVKEHPYGKGMVASPEYQLLERGERAVLTCQVVLNDYPRRNSSGDEAAVRWFHQDSSRDNIPKLERNRGHAHEVQRTTEDDDGEMSIYTLDSSTGDPFTEGWFYCQRNRIKGIEQLHKSNIVHITIAEKVCKAIKRKDERYGTLEFAAAIPGNFSTAKCLGGEAKMLCTENRTWDVHSSNFSCHTLVYNTLSDIINDKIDDQNGSTPHLSALVSKITPRQFDKMTNQDFLLVVRAVKRVKRYLYDRRGFEDLLDWVGELVEVPSRVPITTRQLFPELTEELAENLASYLTKPETLHLEHFSVLVSKSLDGGSTTKVGDRTRPNVEVSVAGKTDCLVAVYYREVSWFRETSHDRDVIIHSPVISVRMCNLTALPVSIVFHKNYNSDNKSRCVYWDLEEVGWKRNNCTTIELSGGRVQCVCNHLTSFAILMDPFTEVTENPFQTFLTKVVLSISITFLVLSIAIWVSFKSIRKLTYIRLRYSFCGCLCAAFFFFLIAGEVSHGSKACYCVIFFMHWMFLATFAWMAVDAYWLRMKVVRSLDSYGVFPRHFFRKAIFGASGASLIVTTINALITGFEDSLSYLHDDICWLGKISQTYFLLVPVYTVLCYNIWTFCQVAGIIFTVNRLSQSSNSYFKKQLRSVFSVALSLGCTWLTAPLLFIDNNLMKNVAQMIFILTNGIQGLFIFIFFVLLQPDVKEELLISLSKRKGSFTRTFKFNTASDKLKEKDFQEVPATEDQSQD